MTVITRVANRYFARRQPGEARIWLRANSPLWRHFDPLSTSTVLCESCGGTETRRSAPRVHGDTIAAVDKHNIGFVNIAGKRFDKWCDGTETEAV